MSLIHWWPLNGDLLDRGSNPKNGAIVGNADVATPGILGKCLSGMSGSQTTAGVSVSSCNLVDELSGKDYSFACWFKVHGTHVHYNGTIMSSGNWNGKSWAVGVSQANNQIDAFTNGYNKWISIGYTLTNNRWYHLASVQIGTKNYVYINGSLIGSITQTAIYQSDASNLCIGRETYANGHFSFNGDICDVRIYDHALSVKEVQELSKALMVHYTFNDVANEATTNIIYDKYKEYSSSLTKLTETFNGMEIYKNVVTSPYTGSAKDNAGFCHKAAFPYTQEQAKQPYFQLSFWKRLNQSYGVNFTGYIKVKYTDNTTGQHNLDYSKSNWATDTNSIGKWEYITARATLYTGKTVKEITSFYVYGRNATGGDCDFAGIQLEAKDHPTPYVKGSRTGLLFNEAGYDDPISFQNLELTSDTISGSYAGTFDSSRPTQIRTALDLSGDTDVTVVCWLYLQNGSSAFTDNALYCVLNGTAIHLYAYGRSDTWLYTQSCLTVNAWNHVAVVYSATERIVYVNGKEVKRGAISGTFNKRDSLDIGYGSTTTRTFNGKIADFRIYRTPLAPEDVLELYESKAEIDKNQNVFTNEIIEQNEVANMINLDSWEQGGVQDASGVDANNMNNRARTKYIPVLPNTSYYFQAASGWDIRGVHFYRKDNAWISYTAIGSAGVRTTPADCYYVRFVVQNDNASLDALIANVATFGPVMVPGSVATTSDMANGTDVQVTKQYQILVSDICENHDVGFFKDGTASGNNFYEI